VGEDMVGQPNTNTAQSNIQLTKMKTFYVYIIFGFLEALKLSQTLSKSHTLVETQEYTKSSPLSKVQTFKPHLHNYKAYVVGFFISSKTSI